MYTQIRLFTKISTTSQSKTTFQSLTLARKWTRVYLSEMFSSEKGLVGVNNFQLETDYTISARWCESTKQSNETKSYMLILIFVGLPAEQLECLPSQIFPISAIITRCQFLARLALQKACKMSKQSYFPYQKKYGTAIDQNVYRC